LALQLGTRKKEKIQFKEEDDCAQNHPVGETICHIADGCQLAVGRTTLLVVAAPAAAAAGGAPPSAVEIARVDRVGRPVPAGLVGGAVRPPVAAAAPVLRAASSRSARAAGAAGAACPAGAVIPSPLPVGAAGILPGRIFPNDVQKPQTNSGVGHLLAVHSVRVP
jgi:hypothetical protein